MDWERLLRPERLGDDRREPLSRVRTPFHKDHDRVVFSSSFRRLDRKTQVHPPSVNDNVHTRLAHSLEVGCIGRSLGMSVGEAIEDELPEGITPADIGVIVQSACLAHDIGNPPFGHAGEFIIRDWYRYGAGREYIERAGDGLGPAEQQDLVTYEGNAQGFRILTQLEYRPFRGGMRLTCPTLGAFLKYPWTARLADARGGKFGVYQSELPMLERVADALGLERVGPEEWVRHPLVYLMEAADDICYAIIDIEDGVEMGILRFEEAEALLCAFLGEAPDYGEEIENSKTFKLSMLRARVMSRLVAAVVDAFIEHRGELLAGRFEGALIDRCDPRFRAGIDAAKQTARERIFKSPDKTDVEVGADAILTTILGHLHDAFYQLKEGRRLSFRNRKLLEMMGSHAPTPEHGYYEGVRLILDYIGGMTDTYTVKVFQRLAGLLT